MHFYKSLCLAGGLLSLQAAVAVTIPPSKTIEVSNNNAIQLTDKPVSVPRKKLPVITTALYPIVIDKNKKQVPSQLNDLDGDGKWDELFFVADLPAKSVNRFAVRWTKVKPEYPARTSVRFGKRLTAKTPVSPATEDTFLPNMLPKLGGFQPYQTDGPSWENDKVGFRHYLDGRNAKDLFGKRVATITPETVGLTPEGAVEDNYHVLRDWGRDILPVGNSVGLGGFGLLINNSLNRVGVTVDDTVHNIKRTDFKILDEGPVYSRISINYKDWASDAGRNYNVLETPSIWPGMYAYQNTVKFSGIKGDEKLVIGLPKVATQKPVKELLSDKWVALYTHDQQSYNREFIIGLAIILPRSIYEGNAIAPATGKFSNTYYAKLKVMDNKPVSYYAVGCWELADPQFKEEKNFEAYLQKLLQQLNAEVSIKVL